MAEEFLGGTLISGADGKVYFIPEADLAAYQLPDELAEAANDALAEAAEVTGYTFGGGGISFQPALHGNLGSLQGGGGGSPVGSIATLTITGFSMASSR